MHAALLAALASLFPAAAAPSSTDAMQDDIRKVQAEVARLEAEMPPRVAALKELTAGYPAAADPASIGPRRAALRKEVYDRVYGINVKLGEFRELRRKLQWTGGAMVLSRMTSSPGKDVSKDIAVLMDLGDYIDPVLERLKAADQAMKDDEAAFQAETRLRAERAERRRLLSGLAGLLALAAAGAAAALAWRRRRGSARAPARPPLPPPASARSSAARLPAPQLQPGAVIGETLRVAGPAQPGPFGLLYPALDLRSRSPVMVQQLSPELYQDERTCERLLACARRTIALRHRHVAETRAVFIEGEVIHLVTEPVQGQPLGSFLVPGRPIAMTAVQNVMVPVIKAVHHAHDNDMLHGDLSPACVFVAQDGGVKVLDFMIGAEARKAVARSGRGPAGTQAYLAPEQELGASYKESDFFSFGVILYQMVTGRLPFPGPDYLGAKRARRYAPPKSLVPALPSGLAPLLAKALEPEPRSRYRDALVLLEALEAAGGPP